ncbi:MAG: hypothetical protein LBN71_09885 [Tannerella sp.]|jgi:hypothetical protein|nr:hypothetical protein [Tannerella sp.]
MKIELEMGKTKARHFTQADYIKANRKASREMEIEDYGHPVSYKKVHRSKKTYDRKNPMDWSDEE